MGKMINTSGTVPGAAQTRGGGGPSSGGKAPHTHDTTPITVTRAAMTRERAAGKSRPTHTPSPQANKKVGKPGMGQRGR